MVDSTPSHAFTARFDVHFLKLLDRTFQFDGAIYVRTTDDTLTVGSVNPSNTFSVTVTIDAEEFETFDHVTAGTTVVRGRSFDGLRDILRGLETTRGDRFELTVDPDRLSLRHADSTLGGQMPRGDDLPAPPDVSRFADELTCEASIASPAAVEPLYVDADCHGQNAHAEFAATDGDAYLTMSGGDTTYATLGDATHPDGETVTPLYDADYVNTVFDCLSFQNNTTTVRWGPTHPLVLEMSTDTRDFQAVVAPRIGEDLEDAPLHETADELQSIDAVAAGGFQ